MEAAGKTPMILTTILMPLILIVLFTFLSFLVWEKDFGSRITVTSIGFLTVMAFMFVVNDQLPRIAYLTWMHWYMSLCFLMTFIVNVHVSFVHFLNPVGETKLEKKSVFRVVRITETTSVVEMERALKMQSRSFPRMKRRN